MDDDPIPISLVANYMFCPRRAWLESVGETVDSTQMSEGFYAHRNVGRRTTSEDAELFRAIDIRHKEWGVSGRIDSAQIT